MGKTIENLKAAFIETEKKHPNLDRKKGQEVVAEFIARHTANKKLGIGGTAPTDLSYALNHCKLYEKDRVACRALVGHYCNLRVSRIKLVH